MYKLLNNIQEWLKKLNLWKQQKVKCPICNNYNVSLVKNTKSFNVPEFEYPTYICQDCGINFVYKKR